MTDVIWTPHITDPLTFRADMPRGVRLHVFPVRGYRGQILRGKFRYDVSHDDGKGTLSRWGRDTYNDVCKSLDEAKRKALEVYRDPAAGICKP